MLISAVVDMELGSDRGNKWQHYFTRALLDCSGTALDVQGRMLFHRICINVALHWVKACKFNLKVQQYRENFCHFAATSSRYNGLEINNLENIASTQSQVPHPNTPVQI